MKFAPRLSESIDFDDPRAPFFNMFSLFFCVFIILRFRTSFFNVFKRKSVILGVVFRAGGWWFSLSSSLFSLPGGLLGSLV